MKRIILSLVIIMNSLALLAKEYHVSTSGNNKNDGSATSPLATINAAAKLAQSGDTITVHAGIYREWIDPLRGGTSDSERITYRAYPGEKVEIKGSEQIHGWKKEGREVWSVVIPNSFFGDYNPYKDLIFGDWFSDHGRDHHTGEVFLNGESLYETDSLEKVQSPVLEKKSIKDGKQIQKWYCRSDDQNTYIWANFGNKNPNKELVEISARPTCFYPTRPGINYITISGFRISQAATQWGAPTAGQVGMVATHWNKGWIIENNIISDSKCSGITLGKEHGTGHNVWSADQEKDGSLHYIEVIFNTLRNGWNKESIGSHIVRNNIIFNCEQTGICGSMGAAFSEISDNHIYNIWTKRQFSGAEIAGIKFHAPIDTRITGNRIHTTGRGIWLDWMTQGTRVSSNLLYDNDMQDLFVEVSHGPYLVDNNIMLSGQSLLLQSQGGAFVHNLIGGTIHSWQDHGRFTPYHIPHSTDIMGFGMIFAGDDRYLNNLFINDYDPMYDQSQTPISPSYSSAVLPLYVGGGQAYGSETANPVITENNDGVFLEIYISAIRAGLLVDTEKLGTARMTGAKFENPDGSPLVIDTDYSGNKRSSFRPTSGPWEEPGTGRVNIQVWK